MSERHDISFLIAASVFAANSHCKRLQVGCVVTDRQGLHVLGIGWNGNYSGGPNTCDDPDTPGGCGCIHAETNSLLKCDNSIRDKVIYVTHAPCLMCAKAIVNAGASRVVYSDWYRDNKGVQLLLQAGIACQWLDGDTLRCATLDLFDADEREYDEDDEEDDDDIEDDGPLFCDRCEAEILEAEEEGGDIDFGDSFGFVP